MKLHLSSRIWAVALLSGIQAACAPRLIEPTKMSVSAPSQRENAICGRLFEAVNAYRRSIGRQPLARHAGLDRMAQEHSQFQRLNRGKFEILGPNVSHMGLNGRAMIARQLFRIDQLGETVADVKPGADAASALSIWLADGDDAFTLSGDWQECGIGIVVDRDGTLFVTQLFGARNLSQMAFSQRLTQ